MENDGLADAFQWLSDEMRRRSSFSTPAPTPLSPAPTTIAAPNVENKSKARAVVDDPFKRLLPTKKADYYLVSVFVLFTAR